MAIDLVPAGDKRCDVCEGNPDRPKPNPRLRTMCRACYDKFHQELWVTEKFLDPIHREVEPPDDPTQN